MINRTHTNVIKDNEAATESEAKEYSKIIDKTDGQYDKNGITLAAPRKYDILYQNVVLLLYYHLTALYGLYLCFTTAKIATTIFAFVTLIVGGFGITGGAHRLWTHRTYKAKLPLEYFIMFCNCIAFQFTIINWVRDHRLHHKHSDTDADPHNARRGFFYSHIGWLMVKKNDLVKEYGKRIDLSDVENNPVLQFQKKYAILLFSTASFILPTVIPMVFWGETFITSWHLNMLRYVANLNASLSVNSFTHIYGNKPYDANILPTQNKFVAFIATGEGFHNYHHCFPWDYRAAELGNNYLNLTTMFLDFFAWMGWVYDLKMATPEMIEKKMKTTGDGTNSWGSTL